MKKVLVNNSLFYFPYYCSVFVPFSEIRLSEHFIIPISEQIIAVNSFLCSRKQKIMRKMENINIGKLNEDLELKEGVVYNDGELALISDLKDINYQLPCQLEIFVIVLVLEGKAKVNLNGITYEARKNDLCICQPYNIIDSGMTSIDFKAYCICVSKNYIARCIPLAENSWDFKFLFEKNPLCSLQPDEAAVFCQYYELLCAKVKHPGSVQKKVVDALMLAFLYDMYSALNRFVKYAPRTFSSGEFLFKRFIELLESSYPRPRSVTYYADRLHITPKYLSTVCKNISKQLPSTLINQYVVHDIEYLMQHSQKSIKEISWELDFPNLSFFGKYVKKHLGKSPKAYREQVLNEARNKA